MNEETRNDIINFYKTTLDSYKKFIELAETISKMIYDPLDWEWYRIALFQDHAAVELTDDDGAENLYFEIPLTVLVGDDKTVAQYVLEQINNLPIWLKKKTKNE